MKTITLQNGMPDVHVVETDIPNFVIGYVSLDDYTDVIVAAGNGIAGMITALIGRVEDVKEIASVTHGYGSTRHEHLSNLWSELRRARTDVAAQPTA